MYNPKVRRKRIQMTVTHVFFSRTGYVYILPINTVQWLDRHHLEQQGILKVQRKTTMICFDDQKNAVYKE